MQIYDTAVLSYSREPSQLVSNPQDGKCDSVDNGISMKVESLKADGTDGLKHCCIALSVGRNELQ